MRQATIVGVVAGRRRVDRVRRTLARDGAIDGADWAGGHEWQHRMAAAAHGAARHRRGADATRSRTVPRRPFASAWPTRRWWKIGTSTAPTRWRVCPAQGAFLNLLRVYAGVRRRQARNCAGSSSACAVSTHRCWCCGARRQHSADLGGGDGADTSPTPVSSCARRRAPGLYRGARWFDSTVSRFVRPQAVLQHHRAPGRRTDPHTAQRRHVRPSSRETAPPVTRRGRHGLVRAGRAAGHPACLAAAAKARARSDGRGKPAFPSGLPPQLRRPAHRSPLLIIHYTAVDLARTLEIFRRPGA